MAEADSRDLEQAGWSTYLLSVSNYGLEVDTLLLSSAPVQVYNQQQLRVISKERIPHPTSFIEATALEGFQTTELRWPADELERLLAKLQPHLTYQNYTPISFEQRPLKQLVKILLERDGGSKCGVLVRHVAGPLRYGTALKLLLVPRMDRDSKPLLLGFFFPVHAGSLGGLQPEHLQNYLINQGKLRGMRGELEWEQCWRQQRVDSSGIAMAEPKVSSDQHLWALQQGPLEYVTTNLVDGKRESLGGSEDAFCADCDCMLGPGLCGGAEMRRAIWRMRLHGVPFKLHVRSTAECGLGVFAGQDIPKGSVIVEYIGELISKQEESKRRQEYSANNWYYLMTMYHAHKAQQDNVAANGQPRRQQAEERQEVEEVMCVDATRIGNVSRFINHHCNPNCVVQALCRGPNTADTSMLNVLIARRAIKANEEINFDYNPNQKRVVKPEDVVIHCNCGATNCRGFVLAAVHEKKVIPAKMHHQAGGKRVARMHEADAAAEQKAQQASGKGADARRKKQHR